MIGRLIADHGRLSGEVGEGGEKASALQTKVEELQAKITKLMSEKMDLLEQVRRTNLLYSIVSQLYINISPCEINLEVTHRITHLGYD